jgi:thiol:disulfide interchange protein DsbA
MTLLSRREALSLAAGLVLAARDVQGAEKWVEERHYFKLSSPQPALPAGAVAVTEIFSYGCPACNRFLPFMQSIEKNAPANVRVDYLPASWLPAENWPVFQRAYLTAKALGVAHKAHEAMFSAIWKTGELAIVDARTGRAKSSLPSMQDVARFYQRVTGVPTSRFIEISTSFSVDAEKSRCDALIKTFRVDSTPTIIVNGTYRLDPISAGGDPQAVDLTHWLVQQSLSGRLNPGRR